MKLAFFLGRVHHAIKLLPLISEMNNRGHAIEFIIADNSINIDPTTQYLQKYGIHEFYHTKDFLNEDTISQAELDITNAIIRGGYNFLPANSPFWTVGSIRDAIYDINGFSKYLDASKPDVVFGLHENNFWVRILFYLAQEKAIKTCSLMEGIILEREEEDMGKYSIGTDHTDCLFSWSEYDKKFYKDDYKILPMGPAHLDEWIRLNNSQQREEIKLNIKRNMGITTNRTIILFAPPRLDLYHGDPIKAIKKLREYCFTNGFELVLKLHPFQGDIDVNKISPGLPNFNDADAAPFIFMSDIVVTQTSTIALEALILGKQVVELDMDYFGIDQPLWKEGAATLVDGDDLDEIGELVINPLDATKFMAKRLPLADGRSVDRIANNLEGTHWIK